MRGWRAPACLVVLAILLPSVLAASGSSAGTVHAAQVAADRGSLVGPLVGAAWSAPSPDASVEGLAISAASAQITLERSERPLVVTGLVPTAVVPANETVGHADWSGAAVQATALDAKARILVFPGAGETAVATAADQSVAVAVAGGSPQPFTRRASSSGADFIVPGVGLAVAAAGLVEVRGDFQLVVTGLTFVGTSDDGPTTLDTRRDEQTYADSPAGLSAQHVVSYEAILDLRDAVVSFPASLLVLRSADLTAEAIRFEGAQGSLAGQALQGEDVEADGLLRLRLEPRGHEVAASVQGPIDSLHIGALVVHPRPGGAGGPLWSFAIVAATMGVTLAVAHGLVGRQRFRLLDASLDDRRYDDALRLADRFRLHPWFRQDAVLAAALSLGELGRPAEARARLLAERRWAPGRRATRDFLLARAAVRLGELSEATRLLAASLLADPGLAAQAAADPVFTVVLDRGRRTPLEAYA